MVSIGCAVCLNIKGERGEAVAVANGYSACADHLELVSQPSFNLFRIRGEGKKRADKVV